MCVREHHRSILTFTFSLYTHKEDLEVFAFLGNSLAVHENEGYAYFTYSMYIHYRTHVVEYVTAIHY